MFISEHLQCILKCRHCSINFALSPSKSSISSRSSRKRRREVGWADIIQRMAAVKDQEVIISLFEKQLGPELTPELFLKMPSKCQNVLAGLGGLTGWGPTLVQQINQVSNRYLTAINF